MRTGPVRAATTDGRSGPASTVVHAGRATGPVLVDPPGEVVVGRVEDGGGHVRDIDAEGGGQALGDLRLARPGPAEDEGDHGWAGE